MSATSISLITPEFRLSFANLVEPKPFMKDGKAKGDPYYNAEMLFNPDNLVNFKRWDEDSQELQDVNIANICVEAAKKTWPGINVKEVVANKGLSWPIISGDAHADKRDANSKKNNDHYRGTKIIKCKSVQAYPPRLYYIDGGKRTQLSPAMEGDIAKAKQLFTGGNYAYAEVNVVGTESGDDKYITFYINAVVFTRDGDRIGGGSLMDRFDGYQSTESDYDPTEGMGDLDDEIPF